VTPKQAAHVRFATGVEIAADLMAEWRRKGVALYRDADVLRIEPNGPAIPSVDVIARERKP
jgi:hypothetical protein